MNEVDVLGVKIDRCSRCAGIWFDRRELERVLTEDPGRVAEALQRSVTYRHQPESLDAQAGRCPRCAIPLEKVASIAVENRHLDQCPGCKGTWLDARELEELLADPTTSAVASFFATF